MSRLPMSYSRAGKFQDCPARFKAEVLDKVSAPKTLPLLVGSFMHSVLDSYTKHLVRTGRKSDYDEMESIFIKAWTSPRARAGIPQVLYDECHDLMVRTREGVVIEDPGRVVGSEIEIALREDLAKTAWLAKDVFLRMKIDRLELGPEWDALVWDYKTGHSIDALEGNMQLRLYALGVKAILPEVRSMRAALYYPRMGATRECELVDGDAEKAHRWIMGVSDEIERMRASGVWPATPGRACADCPVFEDCPARKLAASTLPPNNADEAEELLAKYVLVDRERKDLQERLSAWIGANGPVTANGVMALMNPAREYEYPLPGLQRLLEGRGLRWTDYVKADSTALKKAWRGDRTLEDDLKAIAVEKTQTRFTVKRAGE